MKKIITIIAIVLVGYLMYADYSLSARIKALTIRADATDTKFQAIDKNFAGAVIQVVTSAIQQAQAQQASQPVTPPKK